jgi:hypothetical protein
MCLLERTRYAWSPTTYWLTSTAGVAGAAGHVATAELGAVMHANTSMHVIRCMLMHMRMGALAQHRQKQQRSSGATCRGVANKQASAKEHAAVHAGVQQHIVHDSSTFSCSCINIFATFQTLLAAHDLLAQCVTSDGHHPTPYCGIPYLAVLLFAVQFQCVLLPSVPRLAVPWPQAAS